MLYFTVSKNKPTLQTETGGKFSVSTRLTPALPKSNDRNSIKTNITYKQFKYLVELFPESIRKDTEETIPSSIRITGTQYFPYGNYAFDENEGDIVSLEEAYLTNSMNSPRGPADSNDFYVAAHNQAIDSLRKVVSSLDKNPAYKLTSFGPDGAYNLKLKKYITQISCEQQFDPAETTFKQIGLDGIDSTAYMFVTKAFNDELKKTIESGSEGNHELRELLARGEADALTDGSAEKMLYDNLERFARDVGSEGTFKEVAKKATEQVDTSSPLRDDNDTTTSDASQQELSKDSLRKDDEKQLSQQEPQASQQPQTTSQEPAKTDVVKSQETPQAKKLAASTLFRYNLYGADPTKDAELTIAFNDGKTLQYKIPANRINSFNSFLLNDDNRAEFEQRKGTSISVTIKATPQSGGEATSDTHDIEIPQTLSNTQAYSFRFSPERGWSSSNGQEVGPSGAIDKTADAAQVFEVFYTKLGGAGTALVDVNVDAVGKKYVFSFSAEPLLVPIEIESNVKEKKPMNEGTVPHWIFIKAQGSGTGNATDASQQGGASSASGANESNKKGVNIAVRKITISTLKKWIAVPNVGVPFAKETFKVELATGNGDSFTNVPEAALGTVYAANDLSQLNLSIEQVSELVYRALFENSILWKKVGGENLCCWSKDSTVTGLSLKAATLRKPSYVA